MNLLDLFVRIGVDDQASPEVEGFAGRAKSSLSAFSVAAGQLLANAITAVGTKTVELGQQAFQAYATYEQMVGGVDKLFGNAGMSLEEYVRQSGKDLETANAEWFAHEKAYSTVLENAQNAYKTAGMSANQYMQQATSFAASMISSLGGDTQKAAEMTDLAMQSMADNVNVFGSNMEDVQNAFKGFSKQNYMMLDNLSLGYQGTQAEMQRLIRDAASMTKEQTELGVTVDASSMSFSNITAAIAVMQKHMGIAGTTTNEAATTIEGSLSMMRASWENLLTAMGTGEGLDVALGNFTASLETFGSNAIPVVSRIVESVSQALPPMLDQLGPVIQTWIDQLAPVIGPLALDVLNSVMQVLATNAPAILTVFGSALNTAIDVLILDPIIDAASGLADAVGGAIAGLPDAFMSLLSSVIDGVASWASQLVADAGQAGSGFLQGVAQFLQQLPAKVLWALTFAIAYVVMWSGQMVQNAIQTGQRFVQNVVTFLGQVPGRVASLLAQALSRAASFASQLPAKAAQAASGFARSLASGLAAVPGQMARIGSQIIQGLIGGITSMASRAVSAVKGVVDSAIGAAKSLLGIASPSKVFAGIGEFTMLGLAQGIEDSFGAVEDALGATVGTMGGAVPVYQLEAVPAQGGGLWGETGAAAGVPGRTMVVNQSFNTRVVRSDQDMYAAATILSRSAMRTAMEVS